MVQHIQREQVGHGRRGPTDRTSGRLAAGTRGGPLESESMYNGRRVVVVMPAYNAARTIRTTYDEVMQQGVVDLVVLVDDASRDETVAIARVLPQVAVVVHPQNRGYGANQKTCYREALDAGADIVIMVHPDYQYTPKLIPAMTSMIGSGLYHCVLGSRILGGHAVRNGMPWWKYVANRALTLFSNVVMRAKLSEYHTGYRAFSRELLEQLPLERNSDDFVFDNEVLAEILWRGYTIAEVSCPTRYSPEASSIGFGRSVRYGLGCVRTAIVFRLASMGLVRSALFPRKVSQ
jgi:glycosyltransferase involved in cell wall biosynthesis